jgi:hypothetical protein
MNRAISVENFSKLHELRFPEQVDDALRVLFGQRLPFVLRWVGDEYEIMGECFVYDFIQGEALDEGKVGRLIEEQIVFR